VKKGSLGEGRGVSCEKKGMGKGLGEKKKRGGVLGPTENTPQSATFWDGKKPRSNDRGGGTRTGAGGKSGGIENPRGRMRTLVCYEKRGSLARF